MENVDYIYLIEKMLDKSTNLIQNDVKSKITSIDDMVSVVEHQKIILTKNDLNDFKNIHISSDYVKILNEDEEIDLTVNEISSGQYMNVKYYATTDFLILPKQIKNYLDNNSSIALIIDVYNLKEEIVLHHIFDNFDRNYQKPTIEFANIPEIIKEAKFVKEEGINYQEPMVSYCIHKNLNSQYLSMFPNMVYDIVYDLNTKKVSFDTYSAEEAYDICQSIIKNGFLKPLNIYFSRKGCFFTKNDSIYLTLGKYLGLSEIPVNIIDVFYEDVFEPEIYRPANLSVNDLQNILSPYILLEGDNK